MRKLKRPRLGGRAKGTPNTATADVRAAAQAYTLEALKTLAELMRTSKSDQVRLQAATALLDRAHGKPARPVAQTPEPQTEVDDDPPHGRFLIPDNGRGDNDWDFERNCWRVFPTPGGRPPDHAAWPRANCRRA